MEKLNWGLKHAVPHMEQHGYVALVVMPLSPPEWYKKQNKASCLVFGAEL